MNPRVLVLRMWNSAKIEYVVVRNLDKVTIWGFQRIPSPPATPLASMVIYSHPFQTFWAVFANSSLEHLVSWRNIIPELSLSILLFNMHFFSVLLQPLMFQVVICIEKELIWGRKGCIYGWILPWSHQLFSYFFDSLDITWSSSFVFFWVFPFPICDFERLCHYS